VLDAKVAAALLNQSDAPREPATEAAFRTSRWHRPFPPCWRAWANA